MRRRSSGAIGLGVAAFIASWAFGSVPLVVVAIGFVTAGCLARAWARLVSGATGVERELVRGDRTEGGDLVIEVRVHRSRRLPIGSLRVRQTLGDRERAASVRGERAEIVFGDLARGRHELAPLTVTVSDPLGLERVAFDAGEPVSVLVRPSVPP